MKTKAIHICAKTQSIRWIVIDGLEDMQRAVEGMIELVHAGETETGEPVDLYVNEEFLFHGFEYGFVIKEGNQLRPFLGNGLLCGTDTKTGETIDCPIDIEDVKPKIRWARAPSPEERASFDRVN